MLAIRGGQKPLTIEQNQKSCRNYQSINNIKYCLLQLETTGDSQINLSCSRWNRSSSSVPLVIIEMRWDEITDGSECLRWWWTKKSLSVKYVDRLDIWPPYSKAGWRICFLSLSVEMTIGPSQYKEEKELKRSVACISWKAVPYSK